MTKLKVSTVAKFALVDQIGVPAAEQTKLYIEGYASVNRDKAGNKNVDRDGEVYDIPSLDIESFRENGPILFNHQWDSVIGQVTHIEKTFEGLFIKAEIHKVPGFESVFYGVQNDLIKAFSISAIPKAYEYLENEDALELRDAELVEISVLAVPSNAQSLFNITNAKGLTFDAKEIAKQNDITLCELKGLCGVKQKEVNMEVKAEVKDVVEPKVEPKAEVKVEPKAEVKDVVEPKAEVKDVVEPKAEVKAEVKVEPDAIAEAMVIALAKTEEIRAEKIEANAQEALEATKQVEAEAKARVTNATAYIKEMTDAFINTAPEDLDTDTIDAFYELLTENIAKIEAKVTETITGQLTASE